MAPPLSYPQRYNLDGNLEDIAPRQILHAPGAISVHGNFRQGASNPRPSAQELRILWLLVNKSNKEQTEYFLTLLKQSIKLSLKFLHKNVLHN